MISLECPDTGVPFHMLFQCTCPDFNSIMEYVSTLNAPINYNSDEFVLLHDCGLQL